MISDDPNLKVVYVTFHALEWFVVPLLDMCLCWIVITLCLALSSEIVKALSGCSDH